MLYVVLVVKVAGGVVWCGAGCAIVQVVCGVVVRGPAGIPSLVVVGAQMCCFCVCVHVF